MKQSSKGFHLMLWYQPIQAACGAQSQSGAIKVVSNNSSWLRDSKWARPRMHMILIWTMRECGLVFEAIGLDQSPFVFPTGRYPSAPLEATSHTLHKTHSWRQICPKLQFRTAPDLPDRPVVLTKQLPCQQEWVLTHNADLQWEKLDLSQNNSSTVTDTNALPNNSLLPNNCVVQEAPVAFIGLKKILPSGLLLSLSGFYWTKNTFLW